MALIDTDRLFSIKNCLVLSIILILGCLIAFGMVLKGPATGSSKPMPEQESGPSAGIISLKPFEIALIYRTPLGESKINANLHVQVALEMSNEKVIQELHMRERQIEDQIIDFISKQNPYDLERPEFREPLREELIRSLNDSFIQGSIRQIFFSQYFVL